MAPFAMRLLRSSSFLPVLGALMLMPAHSGCQQETAGHAATAAPDVTLPADELLRQLAEKYQTIKTYEDAGELHLRIEERDGQKQESPPIPFSVAFERPNKIRIHSLQASIVADGEQLRASADSLENQVLVQPCPQRPNAETLFADPMLVAAARGQIDESMPQITLLLEDDPIQRLAGNGKPTRLEDAEVHGDNCHRVAVDGPQGTSVFWIDAKDGLLRKFEFPADAFQKKFQVAKCSIWADFNGARASTPIAPAAFQFAVPEGAKLLKRLFPPPPSPLLGKSPEDFAFVDLNGAPVNRDSLKDKVAVLDMWATWCGWCFKGFPNLEKVYQQYKDNDKVVILAVSRDEPTVSDANLREAFHSAQVTIPIVRDSQQLTEKVLQVQVLPTMVVFGADGTVQQFHIGYDAELAETLPGKIDQLLAGENLAQKELEKYQQEQKEYDERLSKELVDGTASAGRAPSEIAPKHSATDGK